MPYVGRHSAPVIGQELLGLMSFQSPKEDRHKTSLYLTEIAHLTQTLNPVLCLEGQRMNRGEVMNLNAIGQ